MDCSIHLKLSADSRMIGTLNISHQPKEIARQTGKAESAVKTAKQNLLKQELTIIWLSLSHRNTLSQGLTTSPAQSLIIINQCTQTLRPTSATLLQPRVANEKGNIKKKQDKHAEHFNKSAKDLKPLEEGDVVRIKPLIRGNRTWEKAVVSQRLDERSYLVETVKGSFRRNRVHLRKTQENLPLVIPKPLQGQRKTENKTKTAKGFAVNKDLPL